MPTAGLAALKRRVAACTACDLYATATQAVFGEGPADAKLMLIGEQPGDQEDRQGWPFVGPAGRLLDEALAAAGIDRAQTYVTNAVKHFRFVPRGKRRIHAKPNAMEIAACRPWLDGELAALTPAVVVCLGATAAQALLGNDFRVSQTHGVDQASSVAPHVFATVHPSSILRLHNPMRQDAFDGFVADLAKAASALRPDRPEPG